MDGTVEVDPDSDAEPRPIYASASNLRRQTYGVKPTVSNLQCSQLEAEAQFDLEAAGRGLVPPQPDHNPPDDRLYF